MIISSPFPLSLGIVRPPAGVVGRRGFVRIGRHFDGGRWGGDSVPVGPWLIRATLSGSRPISARLPIPIVTARRALGHGHRVGVALGALGGGAGYARGVGGNKGGDI